MLPSEENLVMKETELLLLVQNLLDVVPHLVLDAVLLVLAHIPQVGLDLPEVLFVVVDAFSEQLLHLVLLVELLGVSVLQKHDFVALVLDVHFELLDEDLGLFGGVFGVGVWNADQNC